MGLRARASGKDLGAGGQGVFLAIVGGLLTCLSGEMLESWESGVRGPILTRPLDQEDSATFILSQPQLPQLETIIKDLSHLTLESFGPKCYAGGGSKGSWWLVGRGWSAALASTWPDSESPDLDLTVSLQGGAPSTLP